MTSFRDHLDRRSFLTVAGAATVLVACGSDEQVGTTTAVTTERDGTASASVVGGTVTASDGAYSMYGSRMNNGDHTDATWLRGVQITDSSGVVDFDTILPGRYPGRAAHIHFEVYSDSSYETLLFTGQLAFDDAALDGLYEAAGYTGSIANATYNLSDRQFSDGVDEQLLSLDGDVSTGLAAAIVIGL